MPKKDNSISFSKMMGGILMVTGTCIGAGMLGLPIKTASLGLINSLMLFIIVWVIMAISAFYMLEVNLWFKHDTNLLTMVEATLGKHIKKIVCVIYLLFLYALMSAYTAGGSTLFNELIQSFEIKNLAFLNQHKLFYFVAIFATLVFMGIRAVDYVNRIFLIGLILSYIMIIKGVTHAPMQHLTSGSLANISMALPVVVTSFGFHLLIPSLKTYLKSNVPALKNALLIGSLIPLIIYTVWESVIFLVIPMQGKSGLLQMMLSNDNPADQIIRALGINFSQLSTSIAFFSFFALTTSFMGVAMGLFDFFLDLIQCKKNHINKLLIASITFGPPIIFSVYYPQGFLKALNYAGLFASVLLIILPSLMVWSGRYVNKIARGYQVKGGRVLLIFSMLTGLIVITPFFI